MNGEPNHIGLRDTFVEMLFALAVAQVAVYAAELVKIQKDLAGNAATLPGKIPAFLHLLLCLSIIATSWVGWMKSKSPGRTLGEGAGIFSRWFVGLLLDVFLVILYFITVAGVEIQEMNGEPVLGQASAEPEAFWLMIVFGVFAVWDLLADVLSKDCIPKMRSARATLRKLPDLVFVSLFASVVCCGMSWATWSLALLRQSMKDIILLDINLLALVFLFRAMKWIENPLAKRFK